ncbi:MAG: DUF445 family protein [Firmicutes bacterium]|nr:DUF445 family protein [Bacillota bacterium]
MLKWQIILMPFVGGTIGWITNRLAIKMMFRPREPIKVPLLPIEVQGLLPKFKAELATNIGKAIEEELLPVDVIIRKLEDTDYKTELLAVIGDHVDVRFERSLPRLVPESIRLILAKVAKEVINQELPPLFDKLMEKAKIKLETDFHIGKLVEEQVMAFDFDELERLILSVSHRELQHLELLGGVLGFIIGIAQAVLAFSFPS